MQKVYNIFYINTDGNEDETQLNAENEEELMKLVKEMKEELEIDKVTGFDEVGAVRYFVCGIGYDAQDNVTDYERGFGDFDTEEEARECFETAVREAYEDIELFFRDDEPVSHWMIQLEECECTDEGNQCIDVIKEENIYYFN